ncbi:thioredoxin domain-containing protein 12 [Bombyx mori]|uniref:Thioredoxin domain-containing protein 12 n=1 Tax=Bombyx mori TaxID=7091 RepID=A0A8R1WKD9_BOMMO|nr:thioredoxin domain-containing protein 12 [Bombyx mori]
MVAGALAKTLCSFIFHKVKCEAGKDNGFGRSYIWAGSLESGIQIATNHKKPVMVIIHKSWCTACKKLKPKFASSIDLQNLSKHFVMINLVDEEEPASSAFAPDGNYIPRIIFLSPEGSVDHDIYNEDGSSQHKYFYSKPEQIVKSMRKILEKYKHEQFDA